MGSGLFLFIGVVGFIDGVELFDLLLLLKDVVLEDEIGGIDMCVWWL